MWQTPSRDKKMDLVDLNYVIFSQSEFATRLGKVEAERQQLAESLTNAERRGTEEKQRAEELLQQVKSTRSSAEYTKQELQDYKNKASRILQVSVSLFHVTFYLCLISVWRIMVVVPPV